MPSEIRSPRTLSSWLELDAHRRPRLFAWWGWWLLAGLAVGALTAVGLYAASGDRAFQSGPLTRPHALLSDNCAACHTQHGATLTRLWAGDAAGSIEDRACLQCHAAVRHHADAGPVGRCVDCHKEHRGHDALVRMPDAGCVKCHSERVTGFDAVRHPPFATPKDGGTLKFNHAVHLGLQEPRRLGCADCHAAEDDGRGMKPIEYEAHCRSCHPLGANLVLDRPDPAMVKQANAFRTAFLGKLEHPRPGQTANAVRANLRDALTRFILDPANGSFLGGERHVPRPLPDRDPAAVPRPAFEWVNRQMADVGGVLFDGPGGCRSCHTVDHEQVSPPAVRRRWWDKARFAHLPHRAVNCVECHPAQTSSKTSDVLIPERDSCVRCHKPGAAGADCVECHSYHDEKGQRAARFTRAMTIDEMLKPRR